MNILDILAGTCGIVVLVFIARARRNHCSWQREKIFPYRAVSIIALLFFPWSMRVDSVFGILAIGVTGFAVYNLSMSIFRSRDLKRQEKAEGASAAQL